MYLKFKQLVCLAIVPALLLATSCGGQKSKNNSKDTDTVNVTRDSAVAAVPDTTQKSASNPIVAKLAAPGETAPIAVSKTGLETASKTINQPPFEKSFLIKPERQQEVEDGLRLAAGGDIPGAKLKFDEAITKNPKNGEAYFFRAKAELDLHGRP